MRWWFLWWAIDGCFACCFHRTYQLFTFICLIGLGKQIFKTRWYRIFLIIWLKNTNLSLNMHLFHGNSHKQYLNADNMIHVVLDAVLLFRCLSFSGWYENRRTINSTLFNVQHFIQLKILNWDLFCALLISPEFIFLQRMMSVFQWKSWCDTTKSPSNAVSLFFCK